MGWTDSASGLQGGRVYDLCPGDRSLLVVQSFNYIVWSKVRSKISWSVTASEARDALLKVVHSQVEFGGLAPPFVPTAHETYTKLPSPSRKNTRHRNYG